MNKLFEKLLEVLSKARVAAILAAGGNSRCANVAQATAATWLACWAGRQDLAHQVLEHNGVRELGLSYPIDAYLYEDIYRALVEGNTALAVNPPINRFWLSIPVILDIQGAVGHQQDKYRQAREAGHLVVEGYNKVFDKDVVMSRREWGEFAAMVGTLDSPEQHEIREWVMQDLVS